MNNYPPQSENQPPRATPIQPTVPQAAIPPQAAPQAQQTAVPPPLAHFQNQFGGGNPKPLPKGLLKIIGISAATLVLIAVIIIAIYFVCVRVEELTLPLPQGVKLEMVKIPAGSFLRAGNFLRNTVTLTKPFYLGKYEVTQAQWKAVMGTNPSDFKGDNLPVENVSWNDTKEFCEKLNAICADILPSGYQFDLPTEAQWEYACRAGTTTEYSYGNEPDSSKMNYSSQGTVIVGSKNSKNAFGLYDMHGNVWEWCRDWYRNYPVGSVTDPVGPSSGSRRVGRGGGWGVNAHFCRSAFRGSGGPSRRYNNFGVRLALVPIQ